MGWEKLPWHDHPAGVGTLVFPISTAVPVPAMELDQGIGYSGTRYAWDVLPASSTSAAFPQILGGAVITIALLAVIVLLGAMRRDEKNHLTR